MVNETVYFCNRCFSKRHLLDYLYLFNIFFEEPTLNFDLSERASANSAFKAFNAFLLTY